MLCASRFAPIGLLLLVAGGCAGGSSCAGVTPIPAGFKNEARIENAAALHVTSAGLNVLGQNAQGLMKLLLPESGMGGAFSLEIPTITSANYTICPGGPQPNASPPQCVIEIDLATADVQLTAEGPTVLKIAGSLPVRVQDLPITLNPGGATAISVNGNGACPPAAQTFAPAPGELGFSIEIDTHPQTMGTSRVRVASVTVDELVLQNQMNVCGAGAGFEGQVAGALGAQLKSGLQAAVDDQFCVRAAESGTACPIGTNVGGICRYGSSSASDCVPAVIGSSGRVDLGLLLATISPGSKSGLDFLLAAGGAGKRADGSGFAFGDLNPIAGGATVGFYGGAEASPSTGCAPLAKLERPVGIPMPDEVLGAEITGWPAGMAGPHLGLSLSERFANYALGSVYNSGLLCIGITSSQVELLSSGTLGLVANSIKDLTIQQEAQQIGLAIRPTAPPAVAFGSGASLETDPLLRVSWSNTSIDFYIWSLDRFVRFMTVTLDLDVPVNLVVTPGGLQPVIDKIKVSNAVVTNNGLLREEPESVATALSDVISGLVGQALGTSLAPIDLNGLLFADLGLSLTIPESVSGQGSPGLRKLSKGSDNFLGIFAAVDFVTSPAKGAKATETTAALARKEVDPAGVRLLTMRPENAPVVLLDVGSSSEDGAAVEYAYRVDEGLWHPFTTERQIDVRDPWIRLQGRHTVEVRSRIVGEPNSLDLTPAAVEVLIDAEPPVISIGEAEGGVASIEVRDFVSGAAGTRVRTRLDQGAWSEWKAASEVTSIEVGEAATIEVEAEDEEGNVAKAEQAIIRGGSIPGAEGCGCEVVGAPGKGHAAWIVSLALAALAGRVGRRSRRV